ncbi:MAG: 30S ribosomal protein S15 [Bacteroides sp.]|nr:MAG: 30S ribosomal protein S15 [Bacteroides sp.]
MHLIKQEIQDIFVKYGYKKTTNDSGSSESQIALLTNRISHLTNHLKNNPKDFNTKLSMKKLVSKRRSNLNYLYKKDYDRYQKIIKSLHIRK